MALRPALLALALALARADVYMHNPRGSNDRNCERNVNRNNGNRMFDSQNNAKGGYACPRAVGDENVQAESGAAATGGITQQKKLYYYEGSFLPIEWTNQHGCGKNSKTNCEIVLQYMCEDTADPQVADFWPYTDTKNPDTRANAQAFRSGNNIAAPRDGIPDDANDAATDTIPDNEDNAVPDTQADRRYGMHESYDTYQLCQRTERNKGLYTADQRMRRNDARGTRQNPNGDRRGLECPEERDYYPYWGPAPWVDVAILSNDGGDTPCSEPGECDTDRCNYYLENSINTADKGFCDIADGEDISTKTNSQNWNNRQWPNNEADCDAQAGATWKTLSMKKQIKDMWSPTCAKTQYARVNQLGNADGTVGAGEDFASTNANLDDFSQFDNDDGFSILDTEPQNANANRFLWQLPTVPEAKDGKDYFEGVNDAGLEDAYSSCVLRLRYNITTSDFPAWPAEAMEEGHPWANAMVTSANNSDQNNAASADTPLLQDPYVYVGPGDDENAGAAFVSLAVNTNQYARTFQDRSYTFKIAKRPTENEKPDDDTDTPRINSIGTNKRVFNLNVRGKRGNIVQTYPGVEYDFAPNSLAVDEGDMIHFQWQGSDYNPRRGCNDAEGGPPDPNDFTSGNNANQNSRADRANIVMMNTMAENVPMDMLGYSNDETLKDDDTKDFEKKWDRAKDATVSAAPCGGDDDDECYEMMMRLTYLNQQSDGGALALRRSADCLTEDELDNINDKNTRENHPLNCAKLNAKPYPYFDGGTMKASAAGKFSFFSSRNNNFSNRDQTGIICVRGTDDDGEQENCKTEQNVLQDTNSMLSTAPIEREEAEQDPAICNEEASRGDGKANNFGASSCLEEADPEDDLLVEETTTIEQKDNDAIGDGNKDPCDVIFWDFPTLSKVEQALILIFVLFAVGICCVFCGNYLYNMYFRKAQQGKEFDVNATDWKKGHETGKDSTVV